MAQNLLLHPEKKDYVVVDGSPVPSQRVHESCYFALAIPSGRWLHGVPGQGSLLYRLQGAKRTAQTERLFAAYATDAIRSQVVGTGQAVAASVRNLDSARYGSSNQINVVPKVTNLASQLGFKGV
jgi:phage gp46-like protein